MSHISNEIKKLLFQTFVSLDLRRNKEVSIRHILTKGLLLSEIFVVLFIVSCFLNPRLIVYGVLFLFTVFWLFL